MTGRETASVVTTEKRSATSIAAVKPASPMPSTGTGERAFSSARPVSSKQAMTTAS